MKNIQNKVAIYAVLISLSFILMSSSVLASSSIIGSLGSNVGTEQGLSSLTAKSYNQTWLSFDGVNDKVNATIDTGNNLTYSFWIKSSSKANYKRILGTEDKAVVMFDNSADQKIQFSLRNTTNSYNLVANHTNPLNTWEHYSFRYRQSDDAARIYLNGVLNNSGVTNIKALNTSTNNVFGIGGLASYYNGSIDEVRVYNYSLYDTQIESDYLESERNKGEKIIILSYHQINNVCDSSTIVCLDNFTGQMQYLSNAGYETITLQDYYNWTKGLKIIPQKSLIITFDDGFENVLNGSNVMDSLGFIGNLAIYPTVIGSAGRLSWNQIQTLANSGWEIASHSFNHSNMTDPSTNISYQFSVSKSMIEGNLTGVIVNSFIYPYNSYNSTTNDICSTNYNLCTADSGSDTAPYYSYKRSNLTHGEVDRTIIDNETTIDDFKKISDKYYGLVAHYKFNEYNGTTAYDFSGNNKNGDISGATWQTDGVFITLNNVVDYSINLLSGTWTLLNSVYDKGYISLEWVLADNGSECSPIYRTGGYIIMVFSSLATAAFSLWFLTKDGFGEVTLGKLVIAFIGIMFALVVWTQSGQNLFSACT